MPHRGSRRNDWLYFEYGARTIAHTSPIYGSALHMYAHHSFLQIGPPPLLAVAGFQWLSPTHVDMLFIALMALGGVLVVWCAEHITQGRFAHGRIALVTAIGVVALWSHESAEWHHLDDAIAITACVVALMLVARGQLWWLAGALIGVAVASKPWAIVLAPILFGLTRNRRAPAALIAMATAAAFWAPFVLADGQTISELGQVRLPIDLTSTLTVFGVHAGTFAPSWVRPVQMVGGFLLTLWLARSGRWLAVPVVGLLFRVVTDPQAWPYYGVGPVVGAYLWDLNSERRIPVMTIAVATVEFAGPSLTTSEMPWIRLALFAGCVAAVLRAGVSSQEDEAVPRIDLSRCHHLRDHAQALAV